jgi:hypothetical protein
MNKIYLDPQMIIKDNDLSLAADYIGLLWETDISKVDESFDIFITTDLDDIRVLGDKGLGNYQFHDKIYMQDLLDDETKIPSIPMTSKEAVRSFIDEHAPVFIKVRHGRCKEWGTKPGAISKLNYQMFNSADEVFAITDPIYDFWSMQNKSLEGCSFNERGRLFVVQKCYTTQRSKNFYLAGIYNGSDDPLITKMTASVQSINFDAISHTTKYIRHSVFQLEEDEKVKLTELVNIMHSKLSQGSFQIQGQLLEDGTLKVYDYTPRLSLGNHGMMKVTSSVDNKRSLASNWEYILGRITKEQFEKRFYGTQTWINYFSLGRKNDNVELLEQRVQYIKQQKNTIIIHPFETIEQLIQQDCYITIAVFDVDQDASEARAVSLQKEVLEIV